MNSRTYEDLSAEISTQVCDKPPIADSSFRSSTSEFLDSSISALPSQHSSSKIHLNPLRVNLKSGTLIPVNLKNQNTESLGFNKSSSKATSSASSSLARKRKRDKFNSTCEEINKFSNTPSIHSSTFQLKHHRNSIDCSKLSPPSSNSTYKIIVNNKNLNEHSSNIKTEYDNINSENSAKSPIDFDNNCAVIQSDGEPCFRSMSCKSHSMKMKREVKGRSRGFDTLLKNQRQRIKEQSNETKKFKANNHTIRPSSESPNSNSKKNNIFIPRLKSKTSVEMDLFKNNENFEIKDNELPINKEFSPEDDDLFLEDLSPEEEANAVIEGFKRLQPMPLAFPPGQWIEERPLFCMLEVIREAMRLAK